MNYNALRPYLAKILAPFVAFIVVYLKHRFNIEFTGAETDQALNALVDLVVFAISSGVTAVTLNKKVNPGNAASSHLAAQEVEESQLIKTTTEAPVFQVTKNPRAEE